MGCRGGRASAVPDKPRREIGRGVDDAVRQTERRPGRAGDLQPGGERGPIGASAAEVAARRAAPQPAHRSGQGPSTGTGGLPVDVRHHPADGVVHEAALHLAQGPGHAFRRRSVPERLVADRQAVAHRLLVQGGGGGGGRRHGEVGHARLDGQSEHVHPGLKGRASAHQLRLECERAGRVGEVPPGPATAEPAGYVHDLVDQVCCRHVALGHEHDVGEEELSATTPGSRRCAPRGPVRDPDPLVGRRDHVLGASEVARE
jgi:hypothetical protein